MLSGTRKKFAFNAERLLSLFRLWALGRKILSPTKNLRRRQKPNSWIVHFSFRSDPCVYPLLLLPTLDLSQLCQLSSLCCSQVKEADINTNSKGKSTTYQPNQIYNGGAPVSTHWLDIHASERPLLRLWSPYRSQCSQHVCFVSGKLGRYYARNQHGSYLAPVP